MIETPQPTSMAIPDWANQTEEIHCPLCAYNLRGLTEPRCPECGYAFEWSDLTDPTKKKHPYLFEHHPERNLRSFIQTVIGQLLPRRFWRCVRPEMPSNRRRVGIYCGLVTGFALFWLLLPTLFAAVNHPMWTYGRRQQLANYYASNDPDAIQSRGDVIRLFGSIDAALDYQTPRVTQGEYWQRYAHVIQGRAFATLREWRVCAAVVIVAWPWATWLVLQIFRVSLRQARIMPIHLLRAITYSGDAVILLAVSCTALYLARMARTIFRTNGDWPTLFYWFEPIAVAILMPLLLYRLYTAFSLYLHLKHALQMIVLTQVILLLCILAAIARSNWLTNYVLNQWLQLVQPM